jgi:hypothetical protein
MPIKIKQIGEEYNEEMLRILRESPMVSDGLTLCLDRSPDMFRVPKLFFDANKAYGFFIDERLVGYGMIWEKEAYINGSPKLVGYFANLYIKKEARKMGWLYRASESLFSDIMERTNIGYATIVQGNRDSESLVGRRIEKFPFMPHSASVGLYLIENILVTFKKRPKTKDRRPKLITRRASSEDLSTVAELLDMEYRQRLFGRVLNAEKLQKLIEARPGFEIGDYWVAERDGVIVGVCSAWDVKEIRKIRVMEYRKQFLWITRLYKLMRPIFRFPKLPKKGDAFKEIIINDFACKYRDPEILKSMLIHLYNKARKEGYNMVQIGSYAGDPILKAAKPFFKQGLYSVIVLGTAEEELIDAEKIDISRPYIDIALT